MKLHRLPLFAVVAAFALPQLTLNAQTTVVATDPVGFTTVNVTPGTGTTRRQTLLSIPLLDVDSAVTGLTAGTISAVTSNSIVVSNAGWTPGALSQPASPFVIQITSGPAAGRFFLVASSATTGGASGSPALANTTSNIFISPIDGNQFSNNLANVGVAANATFKLYACDTLSWFGSPATTGIRGGTNTNNADTIVVTINGSPTTYYYNTTVSNWVRSPTTSSQANVALVPNFGVSYNRIATNLLSFVSTGQVPVTNRIVPIRNQGTTVLAQYWPVATSLTSLGIQNIPGWVRGTNQALTDNVIVVSGGTPTTYYYNSLSNHWCRFPTGANQNNVQIPIGAAVQIIKKGSAAGFSPLTQSVPYTLN